jgi:hypothetical protein
MAKLTTMKDLAEFCKSWKVEDNDGFKEIVSSYLAITGNQQRVLADEFEAAISTVSRWASGFARPRTRMKRDVVGWISKRALAAASRVEPSSSASWSPPPVDKIAAKSGR